jgi:hypothetical protein
MFTEHRFNAGVVTLNYAEGEASGPPLVLLHGGSARWQSALPLIAELSQHWQVMETVGHPLHTQEKEPVLLALTVFLNTL